MGWFAGQPQQTIVTQWYACDNTWETMPGDDVARQCQACNSKVYDLTGLTDAEIRRFVEFHEGHVCGMIHRDRRGHVVNGSCKNGVSMKIGRIALIKQSELESVHSAISLAEKRLRLLHLLAGLCPSPTSGHRRGAAPLCSFHLGALPLGPESFRVQNATRRLLTKFDLVGRIPNPQGL